MHGALSRYQVLFRRADSISACAEHVRNEAFILIPCQPPAFRSTKPCPGRHDELHESYEVKSLGDRRINFLIASTTGLARPRKSELLPNASNIHSPELLGIFDCSRDELT